MRTRPPSWSTIKTISSHQKKEVTKNQPSKNALHCHKLIEDCSVGPQSILTSLLSPQLLLSHMCSFYKPSLQLQLHNPRLHKSKWTIKLKQEKYTTKSNSQIINSELLYVPSGSWGFFKSSSVNRLSSSIKSESSSNCTTGELFGAFLMAKDEPMFQEGFLALTYDPREKKKSRSSPLLTTQIE